ncbi:MAG: hypothetical protein JW881_11780 [Spirochaetales bacterium]|nr:hypothetical protein [Spirochaetales bacterium]
MFKNCRGLEPLFQIKILTAVFVIVFCAVSYGEANTLLQTVQYKNPKAVDENGYFCQRYVDDPHHGEYPPQLLSVKDGVETFLTCAIDAEAGIRYDMKNETLRFSNECGGFSFHLRTYAIGRGGSDDAGTAVILPFSDGLGRTIDSDDFGLFYIKGSDVRYILLMNAAGYRVADDGRYIAILVNTYSPEDNGLFLFDRVKRESIVIDTGMVVSPEFVSNTSVAYKKNNGIVIFDMKTRRRSEVVISANRFQFLDEKNLFYTHRNVLYRLDIESGKRKKILDRVTGKFHYSPGNQLLVYENNDALCFYYPEKNGMLADNITILDHYDDFECIGSKVYVLRAEYRNYTDAGRLMFYETEILYLEQFDRNGRLSGLAVLHVENYADVITSDRIKNTFDIYRGIKIVYTSNSCRDITMADWNGEPHTMGILKEAE